MKFQVDSPPALLSTLRLILMVEFRGDNTFFSNSIMRSNPVAAPRIEEEEDDEVVEEEAGGDEVT